MNIAVYPGSFDPITNGHLDIIERAAKIFDKLIVAVLVNANKTPNFTTEERVEFVKEATKGIQNVEVKSFSGLLIDLVKMNNASCIVKGLRAVSDFEYEMQMALLNKKLDSEIETFFMMTNLNYSFLSSSSVRELAGFRGNIDGLVPEAIKEKIYNRFAK